MTPKKPTWQKLLKLALEADPTIWICAALIALFALLAWLLPSKLN